VTLTPEQRAELEAFGPENVRAKLSPARPGRASAVSGFKTGQGSAGDDGLVMVHDFGMRCLERT
jgi:hypothetical protein